MRNTNVKGPFEETAGPIQLTITVDGNLLEYIDAVRTARALSREDAVLEVLYATAEFRRVVLTSSREEHDLLVNHPREPSRSNDRSPTTVPFKFDRASAITAVFFGIGVLAALIYVVITR